MLKLSTPNWLKILSPVALAAGIFLATALPAKAVPRVSVSTSRYSSGTPYRHRKVVSPPSLNIIPPPGTHTPLPTKYRANSYRSRYSRGERYYRGDRYHRSRNYRSRDRYGYRGNCRSRNRRRRNYSNYGRRYKRANRYYPVRRY